MNKQKIEDERELNASWTEDLREPEWKKIDSLPVKGNYLNTANKLHKFYSLDTQIEELEGEGED